MGQATCEGKNISTRPFTCGMVVKDLKCYRDNVIDGEKTCLSLAVQEKERRSRREEKERKREIRR